MMSDERVETKRYIKRIHQEAKERELDEKITRAEQERILKQKQLEQEEKLAQVKLTVYGLSMLILHIGIGKVEAERNKRFKISAKDQRN